MLEERAVKVKETVGEVYNCLISKNNCEQLNDYFEYLLYCKEENKSDYKGLCVVDNRKGECSYFVEKLFECLIKLEIITDYKLKESVNGIDIYLAGPFSIACGEKKNLKPYKELNKGVNFNDLYPYQIVYETPDKDEFVDSFYRYANSIDKDCYFDEGFDKEIREYVSIVYSRSHRRNYDFVADLYKRVVDAAQKRKNYANKYSAEDVPYYDKPLSVKECVDEAKKNILFCKDVPKFFNRFVNENRQINDRIGYNVFVKADDIRDIDKFAKCYASLLYSKEYRLTNISYIRYEFDINEGVDTISETLMAKDSISSLIRIKNVGSSISEDLLELVSELDEYCWLIETEEEISEPTFSYIDLDSNDSKSLEAYLKDYLYGRVIKNNAEKDLLNAQYPNHRDFDKAVAEAIKVNGTDDSKTKESLYDKLLKDDEEIDITVKKLKEKGYNKRNVLIMASSSFSKGRYNATDYECGSIKGSYLTQLEPTCKVLAKKLAQKGEYITNLIIFDTSVTASDTIENNKRPYNEISDLYVDEQIKYSATEFLLKRLSYLNIDETDIHTIKIEERLETSISKFLELLNRLYSEEEDIKLYLDIHGGLRENQVVLDAIVSLLKITDIELTDVLYAEYNGKASVVRFIKEIFDIYDLVSGVNEFINFGRTKSLETFDRASGMDNKDFIDKIKDISNSIQLCQMDNFMGELKKLNEISSKADSSTYIGMFNTELRNGYRVRLFGKDYNLIDLAKDGNYNSYTTFACQLMWCMEKDFIQQALTLIESKTAIVLEEEGIIVNRKNNLLEREVYSKLLGYNRSVLKENSFKDDLAGFTRYTKLVEEAFVDDKISCYKIDDEFNQWLNNGVVNNPGESNTYKRFNNKSKPFEDINISSMISNINNIIKNCVNSDKVIGFVINEVNKHKNPEANNYPSNTYLYHFQCRVKGDDAQAENIKYKKMEVCVNNKLTKDSEILSFVYIFLYVCKNLKLLRNDANHALGKSKIDIETLKTWIEIYLILMRDVIEKGK